MPTVATVEDFETRFPELSSAGELRIIIALDDAESDCSATAYGTSHLRAILHLAAHRIASQSDLDLNAVGGQAGAFSAGSADGVSFTREMPKDLSPSEIELWATHYGQRFLELRRQAVAGPIVARG